MHKYITVSNTCLAGPRKARVEVILFWRCGNSIGGGAGGRGRQGAVAPLVSMPKISLAQHSIGLAKYSVS